MALAGTGLGLFAQFAFTRAFGAGIFSYLCSSQFSAIAFCRNQRGVLRGVDSASRDSASGISSPLACSDITRRATHESHRSQVEDGGPCTRGAKMCASLIKFFTRFRRGAFACDHSDARGCRSSSFFMVAFRKWGKPIFHSFELVGYRSLV